MRGRSNAASRDAPPARWSSFIEDGPLRFPVREEMRVDKVVDDGLAGGIDRLELQPHADAAIAPRDAALGIDVALRPRHPESHLDARARVERTGGADRDAAATEVQRQRRGD